MGNEEPSGQQAGEPALVCGCGWEGSYADLNETAEGMACPKCRLSRNMDCAATPPAQGVEPGVFVVDAAIQDVSDEAVSLTAKRLRESGLPNVAQIMLTLSALLNGARTALATAPAPSASFRDRLEELAQDWSSRKYNCPSDRVSDEEYARNEGKEDAYQDAAIDLCRLLKEPETSPPWQKGDAVQWACERWRAEVANRPLVNTHRRALDTTWRQVVRHFGGDDVALLGPCHDDLVSAQKGTGNDG